MYEDFKMDNKLSYEQFVRNTIILSMLIILLIFGLFGGYFQSNSIEKSLKNDAQVMADLVFQNLYTVMKNGGNKEVINNTIFHLQENIPHVNIQVLTKKENEVKELVKNVFDSKISAIERDESYLNFATPILFKTECIACHLDVKVNDVASVIYIEHPIMDLKIPLKEILTMSLILLFIIIVVFFSTLYHLLHKYFVKPILRLSNQIHKSTSHHDLKTKILIDTRIKEIKELEDAFNKQNKELMNSYQKIVDQSNTDSLTQIFNRKKFDEYSTIFLNESKRYNNTFSLVLIDLNKFKPINDTYGHDIGDKVLIFFAKTISRLIRESDFFFRTGGDEFILLLPNTKYKSASVLINKIKENLKKNHFTNDSLDLELSASFGTCEYEINFQDINIMIKIADDRMYKDKKNYGSR